MVMNNLICHIKIWESKLCTYSIESALWFADRRADGAYFTDTASPNFIYGRKLHLSVSDSSLHGSDASLTDTSPPTIPRVDFTA